MKLHATLGNRYSSLKFLLGVHLDFLSFFLSFGAESCSSFVH
jgi:hypothetical protein